MCSSRQTVNKCSAARGAKNTNPEHDPRKKKKKMGELMKRLLQTQFQTQSENNLGSRFLALE
jgi:hypothetical protein